jgi:glycosyltransferase involved in cell wall biosynthesis
MNHWLIKIGKAWAVLRRDGLVRGGRRIKEAVATLFMRIEEGDILLVSGGVGDSARYRTVHVAEELCLHGFRAVSTVQDNPKLLGTASRFKVVVLHRTLFTEKMQKYLELLKQNKVTVLFETDDLVYDPQYLKHMDYYTKMNTLEKKLYENGVAGEILSNPYVRHATTTTTFLKKKLEEKGKKVFLVTNKMCEQDVAWAAQLRQEREEQLRGKMPKDESVVKISYLSGTPSHNKDFATITGALCRILKEFPQARLVLAGPLDTEDALNEFSSQIIRVPFAPRKEYFATVASMDINVAPLERGNPFCESKSELKFFEAGLLGVPTVAVANETYTGAITDGVDGLVASTEEEWYQKLKVLIEDPQLRQTIRDNALQTALQKYTTKSGTSEEYYEFLRSVI